MIEEHDQHRLLKKLQKTGRKQQVDSNKTHWDVLL